MAALPLFAALAAAGLGVAVGRAAAGLGVAGGLVVLGGESSRQPLNPPASSSSARQPPSWRSEASRRRRVIRASMKRSFFYRPYAGDRFLILCMSFLPRRAKNDIQRP